MTLPSPPATTVIVPESAFDEAEYRSYNIVQAVIDFVNRMFDEGLYLRHELPQVALQAYHADYYLAEVNNGGHSQFIHNVGENIDQVCADALAGLTAMGATRQAKFLREMMDWVAANPDAAKEQTGFKGGRAPVLDGLDDLFYEAETVDPISERAVAWIRSWPNLRKVEDDAFSAEMEALVSTNPKRARRLSAARINSFHHAMTDYLHAAIALAAGSANPPEALLSIRIGYHVDIEGKNDMGWVVETDQSRRFALVDFNGARVYEYLDRDRRDPIAGDLLGSIDPSSVDRLISYAKTLPVAAAADLLLRRARPAVERAVLSPQWTIEDTSTPIFHIVTDEEAFTLTETPAGFVLGSSKSPKEHRFLATHDAQRHAEAARDH